MSGTIKILDLATKPVKPEDFMLVVGADGQHNKVTAGEIIDQIQANVETSGAVGELLAEANATLEAVKDVASGVFIPLGSFDASTGIATISETGATYSPTAVSDKPKGSFFNIVKEGLGQLAGEPQPTLYKIGGSLQSTGTKWSYLPPKDNGYEKITALEVKAVTATTNNVSSMLSFTISDESGQILFAKQFNGAEFPYNELTEEDLPESIFAKINEKVGLDKLTPEVTAKLDREIGTADVSDELLASINRKIGETDLTPELLVTINSAGGLQDAAGAPNVITAFTGTTGLVVYAILKDGKTWPYEEEIEATESTVIVTPPVEELQEFASADAAYAALGPGKEYWSAQGVRMRTIQTLNFLSLGNTGTERTYFGTTWRSQSGNVSGRQPWSIQELKDPDAPKILRFELRPGDNWYFAETTDANGNIVRTGGDMPSASDPDGNSQNGKLKERAEIYQLGTSGTNAVPIPWDVDLWYADQIFIEPDPNGKRIFYRNTAFYHDMFQFHGPGGGGPIVGLNYANYDVGGTSNTFTLETRSGPESAPVSKTYPKKPYNRGEWIPRVMCIRPSKTTGNSQIRLWIGTELVITDMNTTIGYSDSSAPGYIKAGQYRTAADDGTSAGETDDRITVVMRVANPELTWDQVTVDGVVKKNQGLRTLEARIQNPRSLINSEIV